ncbi:hypothetical protein [Microbacterium algeriense]|uniref:hypothetical protein n=1 Tax=Microbacterium algeriense TaxID=2615184 RepID=UPI003D742425
MADPITVTVSDPTTGEELESRTFTDDYTIICAGNRYVTGIGPTAINARKTRCIRNHEFDGVGKNGNRTCSRCHEIKRQERRARAAVKQEGAGTDV